MTIQARDRVAMAARVAADIPEGWWVNLGIGIPVLVADHVPLGPRSGVPFREWGARHGAGAGAGQGQSLADQRWERPT